MEEKKQEVFNIVTFKEKKIDPQIIKKFIDPELSEPYSFFTYYHFLYEFPEYTYMVFLKRFLIKKN